MERIYIRCFICDRIDKPTFKDRILGEHLCNYCQYVGKKPWAGDGSADTAKLIEELEERFPSLFDPSLPVCPSKGDCSCTYKSGCMALTKDKISSLTKAANHAKPNSRGIRDEPDSKDQEGQQRVADDPGQVHSVQEVLDLPRRTS